MGIGQGRGSNKIALPHDGRIERRVLINAKGCWVWQGSKNHGGYGMMTIGSCRDNSRRTVQVHRLSYETYRGPIPNGLTIDHLCRNRACANPNHLEPVTLRENLLRGNGIAGQNARKQFCKWGHPLAGDNLLIYSRGPFKRWCRTCQRTNRQRDDARMKIKRAKTRAAKEAILAKIP